MSVKPLQKILFGSPGTGKSYKIRQIAQDELKIKFDDNSKILKNTVKTVFHPEYTYADFMGKLLPLTQGNNVIYKYYPGYFLRALVICWIPSALGRRITTFVPAKTPSAKSW